VCFATFWQFKTLCMSSVYISISFQSCKALFETPFGLSWPVLGWTLPFTFCSNNLLSVWKNNTHESNEKSAFLKCRRCVQFGNPRYKQSRLFRIYAHIFNFPISFSIVDLFPFVHSFGDLSSVNLWQIIVV